MIHLSPISKTLLTVTAVAVALTATAHRPAPAPQNDPASKVTLISARSAQLTEENGMNYRKVFGPAKFLHNNTYLLCDTALWNVTTNIIDARGHVQIIQAGTRLKSETLQYVVDDDLAKFRGALVELEDKEHNTLRTRYLDYNTKDSVAVFQNGASMRDKDGQIIESRYGSYDSKAHLFVFNDHVNMYADTTFIKTSRLEYRSDLNTAYFGYATDMWQDDNMLSANDGWYDRNQELFFFRRNVHLLTVDQEIWSDSLYYYRARNDVEMRGHVELMDTTRNVFALAGRMHYSDSLSKVQMTREPAVMSVSEDEKERRDTVYLGGNLLVYQDIRRCDVDSMEVVHADRRIKDLSGDPVMEYRRKAAEAAAKAAAEAAAKDPNRPPEPGGQKGASRGGASRGASRNAPKEGLPSAPVPEKPAPPADTLSIPADTLSTPADTLSVPADSLSALADTLSVPADSLLAPADSLPPVPENLMEQADTLAVPEMPAVADTLTAPADTLSPPAAAPKDTTKIAFIQAVGEVKLFRKDSQFSCDSLVYNGLDSLVRLYRDPLVFNEGNRQYAADSIFVTIRNSRMERANLLSNAFVTIQEDTALFDQIRGTEMVAYFDSTSALTRFDALGGASAMFFLMENDALATVNKVESKMLYATFKAGDLEKIFYFEDPKSDAYPVVQLPKDERKLKDFRWNPERRPTSPEDITSLKPRPSQRTSYLARPHADFRETDIYFPGYIGNVYKQIAFRDSMAVVRSRQQQEARRAAEKAAADSLAMASDSLSVASDSLSVALDSLAAAADSLKAGLDSLAAGADSLRVAADSLGTADSLSVQPQLSKAELRAQERQRKAEERARIRAEKQAALEAKWAEEDRRYEERQLEKAMRKLQRQRAAKLKALRRLEKKAQKERRLLQKYIEQERRRQSRQ